jgi:hypothetical protein
MSDHAWCREQIEAYVLGGLTAEETERLENHVRDCADCAAALADARRIDGDLGGLFADARTDPGLEDRAIGTIRTVRPRRKWSFSIRLPRVAIAAGVLLVLTTVGAMVGALMNGGRLPMPGALIVKASSESAEALDSTKSMREAFTTDYLQYKDLADRFGEKTDERKAEHQTDTRNVTPGAPPGPAWHYGMQPNSSISGGISGGISGSISGGIGGIGGGGVAGTTYNLGSGAASTPNFTSNTGLETKGAPTNKQPNQPTFTGGTILFGAYPAPTQNMPVAPVLPPGFSHYFRPSEHRPAAQADPKLHGQVLTIPAIQTPPAATEPAKPDTKPADEPAAPHRVVIRSGDIEFEVDSFDAAAATLTKLVTGIPGAFVATVNSDKLANGKVRGSITVRVPPEKLDGFVLDLRREIGKAGELKGLKIGSQDVTKQYTDLESRLRAARTMEQRLLQIIKDGKGAIKDLLAAEKELGEWRTRIESLEGEIRYYANLAAMATLTVSFTEKEIRQAAAVTESERVQAGVEVEDVDKAYQQALAAIAEAKGRVTKSEVKQLAAGQFNAALQFEVPPEASGPMRDRLRQLGRVARLEIDRVQKAEGGTLPQDGKVKRGDAVFIVQIYNLANMNPRETVSLQLAAADVRAAFQSLRDAAGKSAGRVRTAQLNEPDAQNISAQIDVDVRRPDDANFRTALDAAGEVLSRQVNRAPEGDEFTDSKVLYRISLLPADRLPPRETTTMRLEVRDVDQTAAMLSTQVAEAKGRQINSETNRDPSGKVTAKLTYEVPLAAANLAERFKAAGTLRGSQTSRDQRAPAGKYATARIDVTLASGEQIVSESDGLWPQVRRGLAYSATVLLTSVTWVVFGICVVLPWCVVVYAGYRLVRWLGRGRQPAAVAPSVQS